MRRRALVGMLWGTLMFVATALVVWLGACTSYTTSTIVCNATTDSAGVVLRYETDPPGDEHYCWRVYGDSLAPALDAQG